MSSIEIVVTILFVILQTQLPCSEARRYGCVDGYCVMDDCKVTSGSGRSPFCWVAGSATSFLRCGGKGDCASAANSWGNCKFGSCAFDRAPNPFSQANFKKTCEYKNAKMTRDLKNECSAPGHSFDSWTNTYKSSQNIYEKFQPCTGQLIEEAAKSVIKFCYCYNFCGLGQTSNGCEVDGLNGRLDLAVNLFSGYRASCRIDCKPKDELKRVGKYTNRYETTSKYVFTVTEGTTTTRSSSSGGSSSNSVSANVGLNLKSAFSAGLGYSQTTSYDWSQSSGSSFAKTVSHQVQIDVKPGDTVTVFQVVGICDNSDGNKYSIETNTLLAKGKESDKMITV